MPRGGADGRARAPSRFPSFPASLARSPRAARGRRARGGAADDMPSAGGGGRKRARRRPCKRASAGRVVTQPRKGRQSLRFKPKTSTHPVSMDELIALIDSATGHLGGDERELTSAYRELQRRLRSRAPRRVRDRLFGLLLGAARLLRRGGEGVAV